MKHIISLMLLALVTLGGHAQYKRTTNLPTIRINTYDGQGIYSKDTYKYCQLFYTDERDSTTLYDSVQVRGRGNSTWNLSKKPYRIKFNHKEKFLGKGYANAKSWTLLANAADKSLIRNAVTSAMGEFLGMKFNPAYKFVDLYLNGEYLGNYQISDQIQVRPHRVNIYEQEDIVSDTADVSGGYLLEVDRSGDFDNGKSGFWTSHYSLPINIHSPEEEVIGKRQLQYISDYVDDFESRLQGDNFSDSTMGYRAVVDSVSLANWYLATELSANVDGFYSTYFYKDRYNPLLYWGPLWDYDIAYNNDSRTDRATTNVTTYQMMADVAYRGSKVWVQRMWEDPWFGRLINHRLSEAVADNIEHYLYGVIDSLTSLLSQSQDLNYQKWGIDRHVYHELVLYSSYDQYIADLKQFITDHIAYLSTEVPQRIAAEPAKPTPAFVPENYYYRIVNVGTQNVLDTYNGTIVTNSDDARNLGQEWYFKKVDGRFLIINRNTKQALDDPTIGTATATTNVGTQLAVAEPDTTDSRQLWTLTPQGYEGYYNLVNAATLHAANLSQGRTTPNAPVLSYTNDSRNSSSNNRLWKLTKTDELPGTEVTAIWQIDEPDDYALAWNPITEELHFGSATPDKLRFVATVYNASGAIVGAFPANQSFSMRKAPAGVYIVRWLNHSSKFQK